MSAATLRITDCVEMTTMLFIVSALKLIAEIALMAFLGQWLLGLMAGPRREANVFYRVLETVTRPFVKATRWLSPRMLLDRHVPWVAVLLLACGWIAVTTAKIGICLRIGVALCR